MKIKNVNIKQSIIPEFSSESSTLAVMQGTTKQQACKTLKQAQGLSNNKINGFTLIELLVVILIIAILAAIALPQYQKAILKSRAAQLRLAVKELAQAQEHYYLIHGEYASRFDQLEISFDSFPNHPTTTSKLSVSSTDAVRGNDWAEIVLNKYGAVTCSAGVFNYGGYRTATPQGFVYVHEDKGNEVRPGFYCLGTPFCPKIVGTSSVGRIHAYSAWFYPM